jgi:hypothetical protein
MDLTEILKSLRLEDQEDLEDDKESFFKKYNKKFKIDEKNFYIIVNHILSGALDENLKLEENKPNQEEKKIKRNIPETVVVKFGVKIPPYELPLNLEELFKNIKIEQGLLCKRFYDHPVEYQTNLSEKYTKILKEYMYSEHASGNVFKKLNQGVVSCLYVTENTIINCIISDTGAVYLTIKPVIFDLDTNKKDIKDFYYHLTGKTLENIEEDSVNIKILYKTSHGFFTTDAISKYERVEFSNKLKIPVGDYNVTYSSNDNRMNFVIHDLKNFSEIQDIETKVYLKVNNYMDNLTKFNSRKTGEGYLYIKPEIYTLIKDGMNVSITNSTIDGIYKIEQIRDAGFTIDYKGPLENITGNYILTSVVKKSDIKDLRDLGLIVDSKHCEKKRRPFLYVGPEEGESILNINGNKFKCPVEYPYHGFADKVNCCFVKKQKKQEATPSQNINQPISEIATTVENYDTIDSVKHKLKKTALKRYTKMVKFSTKTIEGVLEGYLPPNFLIMAPSTDIKSRTILNCLTIAYGEDIEKSIEEMQEEQYKLLDYQENIDTWKRIGTKSIDDVLYSVSLFKKVNIIIVQENLITRCTRLLDFTKAVIIYRNIDKEGSYYLVVDENYNFEISYDKITSLVEDYSRSCDSELIRGVNSYVGIIEKQVLDVNGLVVFAELLNKGGYIPVKPSTVVTSIPSINITSPDFKLLTPESQYNSLVKISENYPELSPIGITKGMTSGVVTGIKIKSEGICPVSQQQWETNLIPVVDDLFYIERYSNKEDIFHLEEQMFSQNLQKLRNFPQQNKKEILDLLAKNEYENLIIYINKEIPGIDNDILSKLVWYLINNEEI